MVDARDRIEALANQLWPGRGAHLDTRAGADVVDNAGGLLAGVSEHPHAQEALELMLLFLVAKSGLDRAIRLTAEMEVMKRRAERAGEGT